MKPLCSCLLALAAAATLAAAPAPDAASLRAWETLPVQQAGRVMPLDTFARALLLGISGRSSFDRQPASRWLARVLFTPEDARRDEVFLINHPDVEEALDLPPAGRHRYSAAQLMPAFAELTRLARAAFHTQQEDRSPVEAELISLYTNLERYRQLEQSMAYALPHAELRVSDPALRRDLDLPSGGPLTLLDLLVRGDRIDALLAQTPESPADSPYRLELAALALHVRMAHKPRGMSSPALIPPETGEEWLGPSAALNHAGLSRDLQLLADAAAAYRGGDSPAFQRAVTAFASRVMPRVGAGSPLRAEVWFNRIDPFYRAEILYGLALLSVLASLATGRRAPGRTAVALAAIALLPHTYGIMARMLIMHRPPVTNLYSTFLFVAWAGAVLGLAVEYVQRNRLGALAAGASGLALLLTAGRFDTDGDSMGVMAAVLDSNFWLATHVVTISLGYAGCCIAGLLAHVYLAQALRRAPDDPQLAETFRAVFGTQAFGLLFSFVGTMLGGVWADQSWGRFWGWDPKENGALVIVLWSAILFHARLAGMIGARGFAAGSVLGVIAVLLAWLGVNLLGVGLHSYGFTSGVARGVFIACALEVSFVLVTAPFARSRRADV